MEDASPQPLVTVAADLDAAAVDAGRWRVAQRRRTPLAAVLARHHAAAALAAAGLDDAAIAARVGLPPAAVAKLRASPAFADLVARFQLTAI